MGKIRVCIVLLLINSFLLDSCKNPVESVQLYSDPTMPLIQLPVDFKTYRQNSNSGTIEAGGYYDILNVKGPGCVRSIWLLRAEGKHIEILADGAKVPQADMPAPNFFGTLLGKDPYFINSAPIVSMPNDFVKKEFGGGEPGYTSYLPIPFQDSCRIRINVEAKGGLAAMVNWHKYADDVEITPYRFHVSHNIMNPAFPRGMQMTMANVSGSGFIAGIFMGTEQLTFDDLMYHQGGITWLIDGETDPHAIRGHNMEDDYGFTWGFHNKQTNWFGVPYHKLTELENPVYNNSIFSYKQEAVVYRFMGPDPISFESSISIKTGTRPDFTETVVYYYKKQGTTESEIITPEKWQVTGTFPCKTKEEFEIDLSPEILSAWNDIVKIGDQNFKVYEVESEHSWVNFHSLYFTEAWTPFAITEQAAYAKGIVETNGKKNAVIKLAFDDWIMIYLNGENIGAFYHDYDFDSAEIPVNLKKGTNEIIIKSVNFNKLPNNRLWAFSLTIAE